MNTGTLQAPQRERKHPVAGKRIGGWKAAGVFPVIILVHASLLLGVTASFAVVDSPKTALKSPEGQVLVPDEYSKTLAYVKPGGETVVCFRLKNSSQEPIRIRGCLTSCNCKCIGDLPLSIAGGDSRELKFLIRPGREPNPQWTTLIKLYTNIRSQKYLELTVEGSSPSLGFW